MIDAMPLSEGITGQPVVKQPRTLIRDGVWVVPENERPKGWQSMNVGMLPAVDEKTEEGDLSVSRLAGKWSKTEDGDLRAGSPGSAAVVVPRQERSSIAMPEAGSSAAEDIEKMVADALDAMDAARKAKVRVTIILEDRVRRALAEIKTAEDSLRLLQEKQ